MIQTKKRAAGTTSTSSEGAPVAKKRNAENGGKSNIRSAAGGKRPITKNAFSGKFDSKKQPGKNNFMDKKGKFQGSSGKPSGKDDEPKDWRKFKQEKKELKLKRKKSKDTYEISLEAKSIYEKLKCRRAENKAQLVEKLFALFSTNEDTMSKLIMAHDTARVIQCMLKFATPTVRDQISEKLLPLIVTMSISKYAHFCVLRMFKYGSPQIKSKLVDSFYGHIVRLASHNVSCKILDYAYLTVANEQQRSKMRQEFYGDLYKKSKDANVKQLKDTYENMPGMKASILSAVKSNIEHVANKKLLDNSLVHAVILEYLGVCDDDEKFEEVVATFAPLIPMLVSTKDGAQAAIICFYKAASKHRRAIIKAIKEHLLRICMHEHGHIFIIALLNTLDDTKATKKAIYDTIEPELTTLAANAWGRRVLQWLISPGDTNCFHPGFIANIDEGLAYGKKDKDVRRKEIFEQIESSMAANISAKAAFWLSDKHIGLVTADFLKKASGEYFSTVANALASVVVDPTWTVLVEDATTSSEKKSKKAVGGMEKIIVAELDKIKQKKNKRKNETSESNATENDGETVEDPVEVAENSGKRVPGIEEAGLHIVLKKMLKSDKERIAKNTPTAEAPVTFGVALLQQITDETVKCWLQINRGCFILLNIVENSGSESKSMLQQLLQPYKALLQNASCNGAQLLKKNLTL